MHEHVQFLIDSGIKALVLSVGISEYQHLSEEEVKAITKTVVEAAAGRAVVIAETGEWWTNVALDFAQYAEAVGVDAVMVVPPHPTYTAYSPGVHDDDLYRHYAAVATATELPLIFHLRALRGRGSAPIWSTALIERVAARDSPRPILLIKDTVTFRTYLA